MLANLSGLATGLAVGLVLRIVGRMIQTARLQQRLLQARRRFSAGAIIIQQNAVVKSCFLIEKGEVQLSREVKGQRHILGKLGPGELFSILGLLQSQPQYATVEAVTDTTVLSLDRELLSGTARSDSDPVHGVLLAMAKQLRALADRVVEAEKVVT
jgi:CRP-like cAMP-binding protein